MVKVLSALLARNLLQNEKLMKVFFFFFFGHEMLETEDRKTGPKRSNPCGK